MTEFSDLPPEILEHILEYLCKKDLKSYRHVSKLCRNTTQPIWNKFAYVKLTDTNYCFGDSMRSFLRMVHSGEVVGLDQPFTNFILDGQFAGEKIRFLEQFFLKVGPQIRSLNLKDCSVGSAEFVKQIVFQVCANLSEFTFSGYQLRVENVQWPTFKNFPAPIENRNLSSLTFCYPSGTINGISFWMDLFRGIPCLKILELIGCTYAIAYPDIFTAICTVRKEDPSQLKLNELQFDTTGVRKLPCEIIQLLTDPGLNLKTVHVFLEDSGQLNDILQSISCSLKILEVYVYPRPELDLMQMLNIPNVNKYDVLKNLTVLRMRGQMCMAPLILKSARNLKILSLRCSSEYMAYLFSESWTRNDLMDFQLTKCTELEMNNYLSSAQIEVVTNWIPNVKKLKMPLDDASFAVICKRWSNLTSLEVTKCKISEAGITGLDERDIQIINAAGENGCIRPSSVARANISAMKNLQTLVMRCPSYEMGQNVVMSYCSIKFGLQLVPSLHNVQIQCAEVNDDFWERLPRQWSKPKYLIPS